MKIILPVVLTFSFLVSPLWGDYLLSDAVMQWGVGMVFIAVGTLLVVAAHNLGGRLSRVPVFARPPGRHRARHQRPPSR